MLINCPRCGFEQPQDKYCAQCGVDIDNFKPAKNSKSFFSGALFQTIFILLIVAGLGFGLYSQRMAGHTIAEVQRPTIPVPKVVASAKPPQTAPAVAAAPAPSVAAAEKPVATAPAPVVPPPADSPAPEAKEARAVANVTGPSIIIRYAEISRQALQSISDASQSTGQFISFSDYSAGILPNIEKHMSDDGIKVLHTEEKTLGSSKSLQWFYGLKDRSDPSADVGLTTFLELNDMDGTTFRGSLEIQRNWRELSPNQALEVQHKSFPAIFEIGNGTGFFMSGVLPRKTNLENEDELTSIDIYKILRSPAFQKGDSEFIMFIEFSKADSTYSHH